MENGYPGILAQPGMAPAFIMVTYKNTGSHNTVVLGEENHAPVNAVLTDFHKAEDGTLYAVASADWRKPYQFPDSFIIRQWYPGR